MTEPVADLKHLSTRLPEDETDGDPQTGEGAVRLDDRAGDRIAGDPALLNLADYLAEPQPPIVVPNAGDPIPVEQAVAEPIAPGPAASEPLIPADNQPDAKDTTDA